MQRRDLDPLADASQIRTLFTSTFCLGRPAQFALPAGYVELCLGWYLGPGARDASVAVEGDRIVGYALVCRDPEAHHRWLRRRAARFAVRASASVLHPFGDPLVRCFLRARARDFRALRSSSRRPPMPVHAHLNVVSTHRSGSAALLLRNHIDDLTRERCAPGWFAEVNAPRGRRFTALERVVGPVTDRHPNHTLSWLVGEPVERLTVVRHLA